MAATAFRKTEDDCQLRLLKSLFRYDCSMTIRHNCSLRPLNQLLRETVLYNCSTTDSIRLFELTVQHLFCTTVLDICD